MSSRSLPLLLIAVASLVPAGCGARQSSTRLDYQMGERVTVGPLTYNVVETVWRSQLGEMFKIRIPRQRFLMITISVTNGGGKEVSVLFLGSENRIIRRSLNWKAGKG